MLNKVKELEDKVPFYFVFKRMQSEGRSHAKAELEIGMAICDEERGLNFVAFGFSISDRQAPGIQSVSKGLWNQTLKLHFFPEARKDFFNCDFATRGRHFNPSVYHEGYKLTLNKELTQRFRTQWLVPDQETFLARRKTLGQYELNYDELMDESSSASISNSPWATITDLSLIHI